MLGQKGSPKRDVPECPELEQSKEHIHKKVVSYFVV
jgi:hypothetical protein